MSFGLALFSFSRDLARFDFAAQPPIDRGQIRDLATGRFVANGEAVLLLGRPGAGKTHLAASPPRAGLEPTVEGHGGDQDEADGHLLCVGGYIVELEAVHKHTDERRAHNGPPDAADAAEERGASDHNGRDDGQLVAHARNCLGRVEARSEDEGGKA
jgi:hypothetical protein